MSVRLSSLLTNDDPDITQIPDLAHPLRSHGSSPIIPFPDSVEIIQQQGVVERIIPFSDQHPDYPRSRWSESTRDSAIDSIAEGSIQSVYPSPSPSFSGPFPTPRTETGLIGNPLVTTSSKDDFPIIPTRSPLKPTFANVEEDFFESNTIFNEIDWKSEIKAVSEEASTGPRTTTAAEIPYLPLFVLYPFLFIYGMNTTVLVSPLHHIINDYQCSLTQVFWSAIAFLLSATLPPPILPALHSHSIVKTTVLVSSVVFAAGSTVCTLASSYYPLLLGRILQGLTTGLNLTLLSRIIPSSTLTRTYKITFALTFWTGATGAPLIGAAFTIVGWRHQFWLSVVVGILGVGIFASAKTLDCGDQTSKDKNSAVWALILTSFTLISVALAWSSTLHPWRSWQVLLPLIPGSLLAIASLIWSVKAGKVHLRPLATLRSSSLLLQGLLFSGTIYTLPLLFRQPAQSTLHTTLLALPFVLGTLLSTLLISFLRPRQLLTTTASILTTTSTPLLLLISPTSPLTTAIPILTLLGLSQGSLYSSLTPTLPSTPHSLGLTSGIVLITALYSHTSSSTTIWITLTALSGIITILQIGVTAWEGRVAYPSEEEEEKNGGKVLRFELC